MTDLLPDASFDLGDRLERGGVQPLADAIDWDLGDELRTATPGDRFAEIVEPAGGALTGKRALRIAGDGFTNTPAVWSAGYLRVKPGMTVSMRTAVKRFTGATDGACQVRLLSYDASKGSETARITLAPTGAAETWVTAGDRYIVPSDGSVVYLRVQVRINRSPAAASDIFDVDRVHLYHGVEQTMLRVAATGTVSITGPGSGVGQTVTTATHTLYLPYTPVVQAVALSGSAAIPLPWLGVYGLGTGSDLGRVYSYLYASAQRSGNNTQVNITWDSTIDLSASTHQIRYFVLAEEAFS